jgi:hypothetical protein
MADKWFETVLGNTARAYAAGEVVGATSSLVTTGDGGSGRILAINLVDRDNQSIPMRIWFFRRQPTVYANTNTFAIGNNDEAKLAGWVDLSGYVTVGSKAIAQNRVANLDFVAGDQLWYTVEARGAGTYTTANGIRINFGQRPA